MQLEQAIVISQQPIQGGYNLLHLRSPGIASQVRPGQFVHIKIPRLEECVLRRPFSVFRADGDTLTILYKHVGRGTRGLKDTKLGETLSLIGPLGHGFPSPQKDCFPILVAGGYGMAALYLVAKQSPVKGIAFFGGRSAQDILCVPDFEALGWTVRVATEDGSLGQQGLVTALLDDWLERERTNETPEFFVCGPSGMLKAVASRAIARAWTAWTSVDNNMGCGVGACLTCVLKVKSGEDWTWARACKEGPVFNAADILWEEIE